MKNISRLLVPCLLSFAIFFAGCAGEVKEKTDQTNEPVAAELPTEESIEAAPKMPAKLEGKWQMVDAYLVMPEKLKGGMEAKMAEQVVEVFRKNKKSITFQFPDESNFVSTGPGENEKIETTRGKYKYLPDERKIEMTSPDSPDVNTMTIGFSPEQDTLTLSQQFKEVGFVLKMVPAKK